MKPNRFLEIDDRGRTLIAFGRYEGEYLADVASADPGYLRWILQEIDDMPDDARRVIQEAL